MRIPVLGKDQGNWPLIQQGGGGESRGDGCILESNLEYALEALNMRLPSDLAILLQEYKPWEKREGTIDL